MEKYLKSYLEVQKFKIALIIIEFFFRSFEWIW